MSPAMSDQEQIFQYWRDLAEEHIPKMGFHLAERPPVDIEFTDLNYTVPTGKNSSKLILRSVSGYFKSGELTAILGPSGAGKSTLLNVLAGYRGGDGTGSILINGVPRDARYFRKLSRYIMQEDVHQDGLTVFESMKYSADLKLGASVGEQQKLDMISDILELLRLKKCKATTTNRLSGGEKKRLSIALELVNNPAVIFLDEPTTGLDDLSSAQCLNLLKSLARGGRTVICSIHTPSAKLFALFDNVYIVAEGQCVFQGLGEDIVPFLAQNGLPCPKHFNPADFIIEVSSGEYGYHNDKLVNAIENGRCKRWNRKPPPKDFTRQNSEREFHQLRKQPDYGCSTWDQFILLSKRMLSQQWRDINNVVLKLVMHVVVGLVVGGMFFQIGNDASKTLFNFGFCYVSMIVFMYIPMLPALVWFPMEVQLIKREHFNRWYNLNSYFMALTVSRLIQQLLCSVIYISIVYYMTNQPQEWGRVVKFSIIMVLIAIASDAFGLAISSRLDIINGCFVGPAISVPLMLLGCYSFGIGSNEIPLWVFISMQFSYLRFGIEGIVSAIYGEGRPAMVCPVEEIYCHYKTPTLLLEELGMEKANWYIAATLVFFYFILFKVISFVVLRQRLRRARSTGIIWMVGRFIKRYFNVATH
ncbi:hypothetical protein GE061_014284 [Apolygus lucorum]|uniref:Uncharacterized protein n=1 Tax=Apolygus lucorum TaxID=248454 RepID=A0A6A4JZH2_APOLU|nr:hypothetical protein GE061_014284 [Apolygus lucorum]